MPDNPALCRRRFLLGTLTVGAAGLAAPGALAQELLRTPSLTEGPFYPDRLPLGRDNDLILVGDGLTPAVGEITHLTGRILDGSGSPARNAVVEIRTPAEHSFAPMRLPRADPRSS